MKKYLIMIVLVLANVTHYTKQSSCHYPAKNGGCLTASGKIATPNKTAACPRKYKFGTKIKIDGKMYECQDRTAKKYGDRFDIFTDESLKEAFKWGKQLKQVEIYETN